MKAIKNYFKGAVSELRQVQWPTKNQIIRISTITVVFVFASAFFIGLLDFLLAEFFQIIR